MQLEVDIHLDIEGMIYYALCSLSFFNLRILITHFGIFKLQNGYHHFPRSITVLQI